MQNSLLMLAEGRQSRKTMERAGSDSSCAELSVRLGEALEKEVWKCQLSTQKETGESPPEQKLVKTNPQKAGVLHPACVSLD